MEESINKAIRLENEKQAKWILKNLDNFKLLKKIYPKHFDKLNVATTNKDNAKKARQNGNTTKPDFVSLGKHYWQLSARLNKSNPQALQTSSERRFLAKIKGHTNKHIFTSIWIGTGCVDLFIPNVKGVRLNKSERCGVGLAIEVDGDVHNFETKMNKDNSKSKQLAVIKIIQQSYNNWDTKEHTFNTFCHHLYNMPVPQSRERKRMWTRIFAFTLACHLQHEQFRRIFISKESHSLNSMGDR